MVQLLLDMATDTTRSTKFGMKSKQRTRAVLEYGKRGTRLVAQSTGTRGVQALSVVIVSNRLPISVKKNERGSLEFYPSVGGLATGLASYVNDKRNKWIGWPGIATEDLTIKDQETIADELMKYNCYPVFLKQKQLDSYYNGYSNSILWPLFHDLPAQFEGHDAYWKAYKSVNAAFAEAVLALSNPHSTIWVHDYQLLLLPAMLRAYRPKDKIGFFLHIPFPSLKHFGKLPNAKELLLGMLGSDLTGFHTKSYAENFLKACSEFTQEIVSDNQVILASHVARVTDFPMGIDYDRFTKARNLGGVRKELKRHQRKYKGLKVILTVDRLDPTKGLVERLEAYYEFLRQNPRLHGKVVMAMLAVPSRTEIDEYKKLKEKVETLVKKTNNDFGSAKWEPVDYMYTSMPVESVTALYQVADIAFITPLRDGMNLVAKEYIASKPKRNGVLILSSTAGAAQELTEALLVNPRKRDSLVEALTSAVTMPKKELKKRITSMHDHISTHTVQHWAGSFMKTLQKPIPGTTRPTRTLTRERSQDLADAYQASKNPLIMLDYDGVLAHFVDDPKKAAPSKNLRALLIKLSGHSKNTIAVISGRSKDDLEKWLGDLPIHLIAEHGALVRPAGKKKWKNTSDTSQSWQHDVEPLLEKYAANTPGAFVETKNFSLVWHYRGASPYYAQKHIVILKRLLRPIAKTHSLEVHSGNKIIEIKPSGVHKGSAAQQLLTPQTDFILAIGDDYTDEDMFETLPVSAYTIKVGRGRTSARYRVTNVDSVQNLLKRLAK